MARRSTVKKLPREIRGEIDRLIEGGATLDEIVAHLKTLDLDRTPSRSALGRYAQEINRIGERLRESREVAEAVVKQLGQEPENRLTRLNIELAHATVLKLLSSSGDGEPVELSPMDAHFVARTIKDLSAAAKTDADHILRLRREIEAEQARKLAALAKDAETPGAGIDPATLERARQILGLAP